MKTLILPGFNIKNREWAKACADNLVNFNPEIVEWQHWQSGDPHDFDFVNEAKVMLELASGEPVNIVAKSIGTLVVMHFIKLGGQINKLILCGIPLRDIEKEKQDYQVINDVPSKKILWLQNEFDPHGTLTECNQFRQDFGINIVVLKKLRDDHDYPFFSDFVAFFKGN